ncbi:arylamine N-acetyltransferase [Pseudoruegeria sp. HB172150]|uniref:arylamine N-acetyltransferase family protein n=1 Tax=Pseudoruegeria sp. HB172150 TaxID=2721164 RepID=UPI0015560279|nr:arylamine N-acetyltransferase [Pseudoruegeria sp. HB172150]
MEDEDYALYLARLGLDGVPVSPDGLQRLQQAQMNAIPFEGIDAFLGLVPDLSLKTLGDKMLRGRRGGYCYELNTLYGAALHRAGFSARRVLGRVRQRRPVPGPRSHLAWIVGTGGNRYLSDTGFGGPMPRQPLAIDMGEQTVADGAYRLSQDETTGETVVEKRGDDGWMSCYGFDEAHVTDNDIVAANYVSATWAGSPFGSNLMVAGYDGDCRLGLFNRMFSEDGPSGAIRRDLTSADELARVFDRLALPAPDALAAACWERLS